MTTANTKRLVGTALKMHEEKLAREARREAEAEAKAALFVESDFVGALDESPAPDYSVEVSYRDLPEEPTVSLSDVQRMIENAVSAALARQAASAPVPPVPSAFEGNYIKHFRNEESPNKTIQERQMIETEDGGWEPDQPMVGRKIVFVRGHCFAQTENQVRQLEWMSSHPRNGTDASGRVVVIGGDPAIFVDDGQGVVEIAPGRHVVRGSEAHRAHLRTLGITANG